MKMNFYFTAEEDAEDDVEGGEVVRFQSFIELAVYN